MYFLKALEAKLDRSQEATWLWLYWRVLGKSVLGLFDGLLVFFVFKVGSLKSLPKYFHVAISCVSEHCVESHEISFCCLNRPLTIAFRPSLITEMVCTFASLSSPLQRPNKAVFPGAQGLEPDAWGILFPLVHCDNYDAEAVFGKIHQSDMWQWRPGVLGLLPTEVLS